MNADTKGLQYDYGSIMHYNLYGFSKNRKPTMSVLNPTTERVGQRKDPSNFDWQWLNTLYCTAG